MKPQKRKQQRLKTKTEAKTKSTIWVPELVNGHNGNPLGIYAIGDSGTTPEFDLATKFKGEAECQSLCDTKNGRLNGAGDSKRNYQPIEHELVEA